MYDLHPLLPFSPSPIALLAYQLVCVPSLLLGDSGDELAAAVGDVWDHPAPDRVKIG